jgi:hypothetical protein
MRRSGPAAHGAGAFGSALHRQGDWLLIGAPASDSARGRAYAAAQRRTAASPSRNSSRCRSRETERANMRRLRAARRRARIRRRAGRRHGRTSRARCVRRVGCSRARSLPTTVCADRGSAHAVAIVARRGVGRRTRRQRTATAASSASRAAERDFVEPPPLDADSADGTHWPFQFGYAIAAHGDRAVVGMPQRDFGEGRALVLARAGDRVAGRQLLEGEIYRIGRDLTRVSAARTAGSASSRARTCSSWRT